MRNFYEVLGLPHTATAEQIKSMYRKLARKYHADTNVDDPDLANWSHRMMTELNEANETLSDPVKRAAYDRANEAQNGPPPQPEPTDTGFFSASRSYYISDETVAKRYLEIGLNELVPVKDRTSGEGETLFDLALKLGRSGVKKWLPAGTYSGPELRSKLEALGGYAVLRHEGRLVGLAVSMFAMVVLTLILIWTDYTDAEGWAARIFTGIFGGMLLGGLWVYLPLKGMRGALRLAFEVELGNSRRSWFWHGAVALALTLVFGFSLVDDAKAKSRPESKPAKTAPAAPQWLVENNKKTADGSTQNFAMLMDRTGKHMLFVRYTEGKGLVEIFINFEAKLAGASKVQSSSPLLAGARWALSTDGTSLFYEGDTLELLGKLKKSSDDLELQADAADGQKLTARFTLGNMSVVQPIFDAALEKKRLRLQEFLEKEKARLLHEKAAIEYTQNLAALIMKNMGGGQDLKVDMPDWSYDEDTRTYTISMSMEFHGAIVWSNVYWLKGTYTLRPDGTGFSFRKEAGNITP